MDLPPGGGGGGKGGAFAPATPTSNVLMPLKYRGLT